MERPKRWEKKASVREGEKKKANAGCGTRTIGRQRLEVGENVLGKGVAVSAGCAIRHVGRKSPEGLLGWGERGTNGGNFTSPNQIQDPFPVHDNS